MNNAIADRLGASSASCCRTSKFLLHLHIPIYIEATPHC